MPNPFDETQSAGGIDEKDPFAKTQDPDKYGRSWGEFAKDTAVGMSKSVMGLAKLVPMTVGAADTVISKAFGLGAPASGGALANPVTGALNDIDQSLESKKSPWLQNREQKSSDKAEAYGKQFEENGWLAREAATWAAKAGSVISSPALLFQTVAENVGTIVPAGSAARGVQVAAEIAIPRVAATMAKEAVEKAAARVGTAAGVTTGAVQQGADVASDTYARVMDMKDDVWAQNERFKELTKTLPADKAKQQIAGELATEAGVKAGIASLAINGATAKFGGATAETAFMKRLEESPGGLKGAVKTGLKDAFGEAGSESLEEGYGAYAQNQGAQQVDPSMDVYKGIGLAAGQGAAGGFGLGGGIGALHGSHATISPADAIKTVTDPNTSLDDAIAAVDEMTRRTDELSAAIDEWKIKDPLQAKVWNAEKGTTPSMFDEVAGPMPPVAQAAPQVQPETSYLESRRQPELFSEADARLPASMVADQFGAVAGNEQQNLALTSPEIVQAREAARQEMDRRTQELSTPQQQPPQESTFTADRFGTVAATRPQQEALSSPEASLARQQYAQRVDQETKRQESVNRFKAQGLTSPAQVSRAFQAQDLVQQGNIGEAENAKVIETLQAKRYKQADAMLKMYASREAKVEQAAQTGEMIGQSQAAPQALANSPEGQAFESAQQSQQQAALVDGTQVPQEISAQPAALGSEDVSLSTPRNDRTLNTGVRASAPKSENVAVDPATLPSASLEPGSKTNALTKQTYAAMQQMARLVGKRVEVFENASPKANDGYFDPAKPNTIFINKNTTVPHIAVMFHEVLHALKNKNPAGYKAIVDVLQTREKNDKGETYRSYYGGKTGDIKQEMIADLTGNFAMDPTFWSEVFAEVERQNGAGAKSIIAKLTATVTRVVREMISRLERTSSFRTQEWVTNLQEVRTAVTKALAEHIAQERTNPEITETTNQEESQDGQELQGQAPTEEVNDQTEQEATAGENDTQASPKRDIYEDLTDEQRELVDAGFHQRDARGIKERAQDFKREAKDKGALWLTAKLADKYAAIKGIDKHAYILARMVAAAGVNGVEALMVYGKLHLNNGVQDVTIGNGNQGFAKTLAALQGEHQRFFKWVTGLRAENLLAEGRENWLSPDQITALKALNRGEMPDGTSRAQAYAKALEQMTTLNNSVIDIAVKSGTLTPELAEQFKKTPYVPFYRVLEDEENAKMPNTGKALTSQEAFKKLKGGYAPLNDDLLANMLQNWTKVLDASARNRAAIATFDAIDNTPGLRDVATRANSETKGAAKFKRDGKWVYYKVNDPYLLDAISASTMALPGWIKPFSALKRYLTIGITSMPGFKFISNPIRDALQSIGVSQVDANPFKNYAAGIKAMDGKQSIKNLFDAARGKDVKDLGPQNQTYASMLASGGIMKMGSMVEGGRAEHAEKMVRRATGTGVVLDGQGWKKLQAQIGDAVHAYNELGDVGEQANRIALYERLMQMKDADGKAKYTHAEASFMARDLMDFSLSGNDQVVRFLTATVPFLNARIQGLYKIGRAYNESPESRERLKHTIFAVTAATLALYFAYKDDEDYKRREDWDVDTYWWFKIGDVAFCIPKPFELGAIGTMAQRTVELFDNDEMTLGRYGKEWGNTLMNTFAFNPMPQAVKPIYDVYANKESFTGAAIETAGDQKLQKGDRYNERTSNLARTLGGSDLVPLSPKQVDALIKGYTGTMGVWASAIADWMTNPLMDKGDKADSTIKSLTGSYVDDLSEGKSRYLGVLYKNAIEVGQAYASYRRALEAGEADKAREILADNPQLLRQNKTLAASERRISEINKRIKQANESKNLDGEAKRQLINQLNERKSKEAERVAMALQLR